MKSMIYHLVFLSILVMVGCEKMNPCTDSEVDRIRSPDGKVDVIIVNRNCGATTKDVYRVSLAQAGEIPDKNSSIFLADNVEDLHIAWLAPKKLVISYKAARIFNYINFWSPQGLNGFRYVVSITEIKREESGD